MKCEKCGKNEVNYYYSSNINGKVTERHLCSECAAEFERSKDYFNNNDVFTEMENMFSGMFGRNTFMNPWNDFGFQMPTMLLPRINIMLGGHPAGDVYMDKPEVEEEKTEKREIDPKMSKRRQLNALRHQMKEAARHEDYEKAAELRDKIKELENEGEKTE